MANLPPYPTIDLLPGGYVTLHAPYAQEQAAPFILQAPFSVQSVGEFDVYAEPSLTSRKWRIKDRRIVDVKEVIGLWWRVTDPPATLFVLGAHLSANVP